MAEPNYDTTFLDLIPTLFFDTANNFMLRPLLLEVKDTVPNIHIDSAPSPDGFSSSFFLACSWSIIHLDLLEAIIDFFNGGIVPPSLKHSFIAIIPKDDNLTSLSNFKPISLCQVSYKIISNILAFWLATLMPNLISKLQGAFLEGHIISDSISLALELAHSLGRKIRGNDVILNVDMG